VPLDGAVDIGKPLVPVRLPSSCSRAGRLARPHALHVPGAPWHGGRFRGAFRHRRNTPTSVRWPPAPVVRPGRAGAPPICARVLPDILEGMNDHLPRGRRDAGELVDLSGRGGWHCRSWCPVGRPRRRWRFRGAFRHRRNTPTFVRPRSAMAVKACGPSPPAVLGARHGRRAVASRRELGRTPERRAESRPGPPAARRPTRAARWPPGHHGGPALRPPEGREPRRRRCSPGAPAPPIAGPTPTWPGQAGRRSGCGASSTSPDRCQRRPNVDPLATGPTARRPDSRRDPGPIDARPVVPQPTGGDP
jgi:hypothetical protein